MDKANAIEKKYELESKKIWDSMGKNYDQMTKEQKEEASKKTEQLALKMNLGKYGEAKDKITIEKNSKRYPKHYFKIGYFRSSYNDGGINSVLNRLGLGDLYYIFDRERSDEYCFKPDWEESLKRVNFTIVKLKDIMKNKNYDISCVSADSFSTGSNPENEFQALKVFEEQKKSHAKSSMGNYSCREGEFYMKTPKKVLALIKGKDLFKKPAIYVVYENKGGLKWYLQALEIVLEAIEYVIKQKDRDDYYFSWSA